MLESGWLEITDFCKNKTKIMVFLQLLEALVGLMGGGGSKTDFHFLTFPNRHFLTSLLSSSSYFFLCFFINVTAS